KVEGQENCSAFDIATGKELWSADIDKTIHENEGGNGPRSTQSISDDSFYVLSTYLNLVCLNGSDGSVRWSHELDKEFGGKQLHWGNAASPLIEDDLVIVAGGGSGE